ncbi:MAG: DNA polymerase III subunit delta, partial [Gammaproteobacteria bacterium]|nr:DNA polymerase III subunit delta [Gammaproteobacteria bacterium]
DEAIDTIRTAATKAGFTERTKITPESGTDWTELLYSNTHSLSLFATKKIIEINLTLTKLNNTHGKILAEYAERPLSDVIILIRSVKFDTKTEKSNWYQAIEKNAIIIPIWPLTNEQLPLWIMQRAKKFNLTLNKSSADRLATLVEGNLLAAAQEIEKLALLQTNEEITASLIDEAITDSTRFDIFHLVDSVLIGNAKRSLQILRNLAAEDEEPTLILWALVRELRILANILKQQKNGASLGSLFSQYRIWEKRQPGVRAFLQRHSLQSCWHIIQQAATLDHIIKGAEKGNIWNDLENFLLNIAKKPGLLIS